MIQLIILTISSIAVGFHKGKADWEMKRGRVARDSNKKYELDSDGNPIDAPTKGFQGWWHRKNDLTFKEDFFGSATFLVQLADWWHKYNTFRTASWVGLLISFQLSFQKLKFSWLSWTSDIDIFGWNWELIVSYIVWIIGIMILRAIGFGLTYKGWFKIFRI